MTDTFLQSMTFSRAGDFINACDCEECDNIPPSIKKMMQDKKRQRRESGPIKRSQQRTLVCRQGRASLYCMHMPKDAEPMVEFGSSHRIVWIKRLAKAQEENSDGNGSGNTLRWIGKGIIGSRDEEKSRKVMNDWNEGDVFLIPSNGGKAIGWVHTDARDRYGDDSASSGDGTNEDGFGDNPTTSTTNSKGKHDETYGSAILYVAKIPLGMLEKEDPQGSKTSKRNIQSWADQLVESCRDFLEPVDKEDNKTTDPSYFKFSSEAATLLKDAIREAENMATKNEMKPRSPKRIRFAPEVAA